MTSIIVSSDDLEVGHTIGKKTAEALGYHYLDRKLLEQVAKRFDVKKERLERALDGFSAFRFSAKACDLILSQIQTVTLEEVQKDGVVCANLAAHLFIRNVSHVLMVRLLADSEARAKQTMVQKGVSLKKALKMIDKERSDRRRWSVETFALDENDPSIYDMVISLGQTEMEKAIEIIKDMSGDRKFRPMSYSKKCLSDLVLASKARTLLLPEYPEIKVAADGDKVIVNIRCSRWQKLSNVQAIKKSVGEIPGVSLVEVHAVTNLRKLSNAQA